MPEAYEYLKFFATFLILVIFIYALYYYISNFTPLSQKGTKEIEIIETKVVGKNRYLLLARVKDRTFLLASDESGIKILQEWKESEER